MQGAYSAAISFIRAPVKFTRMPDLQYGIALQSWEGEGDTEQLVEFGVAAVGREHGVTWLYTRDLRGSEYVSNPDLAMERIKEGPAR